MLRMAGLAEPSHSRADLKKHSVFVTYFNRVVAGEILDPRDQAAYDQARRLVREYTLFVANVIVTILFNIENAFIYESFVSHLIIMNEITRAMKSDV